MPPKKAAADKKPKPKKAKDAVAAPDPNDNDAAEANSKPKRGRNNTVTTATTTTNVIKPSLTAAASKKLKNPPCAGGNDKDELVECFKIAVSSMKNMKDGLCDQNHDVNRITQHQPVFLGEKMVRFKCLSKFFLHTEDGKRFLDSSIPFPDDDSLQTLRFGTKMSREAFLAFQLTALLKLLCPRCRMKDHPINGTALGFYMRLLVKYANFDANSIYDRRINGEVCPVYLAKFRERVQGAEAVFREKYALTDAEAADSGCHRVPSHASRAVQRTEATAECGCDHLDLYMHLSYLSYQGLPHVQIRKPSTDNPLFQLRFFSTGSHPTPSSRADNVHTSLRRTAMEALFHILQPSLVTLDGTLKKIDTHSHPWVDSTRIELITDAINECTSHDDVLQLCSVKDDGSQTKNYPRLPMPEAMKGKLRLHQEESLAFMMNRETRGSQEFVEVRFDAFTEAASKTANKEYPVMAFYNPITTDMYFVGDNSCNADVGGVPLVQAAPAPHGDAYIPMSNDETRERVNPVIRGGILADVVGLGKTVELISLIASNPSQRANKAPLCPTWCPRFTSKTLAPEATFPSAEAVADINSFVHIKATLVVATVTICEQWIQELVRFWPSAKVILYHGSDRSRYTLDDFAQADVIVSSYETLATQMRAEPTKECIEVLRNMDLSPAKRKALHDHLKAQATSVCSTWFPSGADPFKSFRDVMLDKYPYNANHSAREDFFKSLLETLKVDETVPVFLRKLHFHRVVLDECQKVASGGQKVLDAIQTDHMWVVSATPITTKGYGSLHPIMSKFLGCRSFSNTFFESMQNPTTNNFLNYQERLYGQGLVIESAILSSITINRRNKYSRASLASGIHNVDPTNPNVYGQRWIVPFVLSQFMIRHIKTEKVLNDLDLPPLQHRNVMVTMNDLEKRLYTKLFERVQKDFEQLSTRDRIGARITRVMVWVDQLRRAAVSPLLLTAEAFSTESAMAAQGAGAEKENVKRNIVKVAAAALIEELENAPAGQKVPQATIQLLKNMLEIPPEIDTCPVCMDTMAEPTMLCCHHFLCRECLLGVAGSSANPKCPICREPISENPAKPNKEVGLAAAGAGEEALMAELMEGPESWKTFLERLNGDSSKINKLLELTTSIRAEDPSAKFVIFSHFPAFLKMALEGLNKAGIKTAVISGDTTLKERGRIISDFQRGVGVDNDEKEADADDGELPLKRSKKKATAKTATAHGDDNGVKAIIISSRAGNAGVTLTAANHLILCEGSLNYAVEVQAMGRIHRLGQTRSVTVHKLVTEDTIEANILDDCSKNLLMGMAAADAASADVEGAKVAQLRRFLGRAGDTVAPAVAAPPEPADNHDVVPVDAL